MAAPLRTCACWLSLLLSAGLLRAEPAADQPIEQVINAEIEGALKALHITPAPVADDATLVRRLTLDLAGRIPTTAEAQAYVQSQSPDKRAELVDRLLASPDYPRHERNFLDTLLQPQKFDDGPWREYLLKTCQNNVPWDQRFRDFLTASDDDPEKKAALSFLKSRARNVDDLTHDTARLFFGVDISCAKCHDHPLVQDWKQDHYFGIAAFFSRTYMEKGDRLAEKNQGVFKFKTKKGEEKIADMVFLTGDKIAEPAAAAAGDDKAKSDDKAKPEPGNKKADASPFPAFSRRALLADVALHPDRNRFFSRAIVNRYWNRVMGRGLVMPVEQMHSENPPTHPALLDWLAKDLVAHGYDLKRLLRGLVLSEVYARSSRWDADGPLPSTDHFAVALVRPLSPRQYALSLLMATSDPESLAQQMAGDKWAKQVGDLENRAGGLARQIEVPDENFQVSVSEALLMSNSLDTGKNYLGQNGQGLLTRLKAISDSPQRITAAYWAVLNRAPDPDEIKAAEAYLAARDDRAEQAAAQLLWALLTSTEFRFNY